MMKKSLVLSTALFVVFASLAEAQDRYGNRPPVIVSPDLTAPWVMQLGVQVDPGVYRQQQAIAPDARGATRNLRVRDPAQQLPGVSTDPRVQPVAMTRPQKPVSRQMDPQYLPQMVAYDTPERAGTIVIDTNNRFLYLVTGNGEARRYGVGVGKPGFEWAGSHKITRKSEWPTWTPPSEMISREAARGHYLPASMQGGPENPLGARAMYLGSTLYRIHGTNAPWTIGYAVSSGCIRMRNEDVVDLYERVPVGTKVVVI
ncbi:lipoprotein-anchoring transpeptidase ErfK/SrfK [Pararhizobium capsulatum DSM 1112]|uniref:Lipoprotein-anchoring transpeptidase ErfK/SrfK n=1 Tax=Pararhizobium capsulatum DSM 1112 TaxID=1121113 RepID=A0ABU0BM27_9HYPH|nr:L,D-transpeptidase [Pararhizobium capsulatum]MDQ0319293.1 lipoprotein-anchoring transpeptidase ErfK/SrfK [Pararhizobium capsulatum DSM 1112]